MASVGWASWAERVARARRQILIGSLLLFALGASSGLALRFDLDVLAQMPTGDPIFGELREQLESVGATEDVVVLVSRDDAAVATDLESFAAAFEAALAGSPAVDSVRWRVDLDRLRREWIAPRRSGLLDDEARAELRRRLSPASISDRAGALRQALTVPMAFGARERVLDDPFGIDELVGESIARRYGDPRVAAAGGALRSPDGGALLVVVDPAEVAPERLLVELRNAEVRARVALGADAEAIRVGYTGGPIYAAGDAASIRSDLQRYLLLAPLFVLAIFFLRFRSLRVVLLVAWPLLVVTALTFAASWLIYGRLGILSLGFAAIFFGLGVDASVHLVDGWSRSAERSAEALGRILAAIGPPTLAGASTSAAVFFAIAASGFTPVAELGALTGVAMLLNLPATLVLLPALLLRFGRELPPRPLSASWVRGYEAFASKPLIGALAFAAIVVAVLPGARGIRVDADFSRLRPSGAEAARVEAEIDRRFAALQPRGVVVVRAADLEGALRDTEKVVASLDRLRAEGRIASVSTLTSFLPSKRTEVERQRSLASLPWLEAIDTIRSELQTQGFRVEAFEPTFAGLADFATPTPILGEAQPVALAAILDRHLSRLADGRARVATYFEPTEVEDLGAIASVLEAEAPGAIVVARELAESALEAGIRRELWAFFAVALVANALLLSFLPGAVRRDLWPPVAALWVLVPTLAAVAGYLGTLSLLEIALDPVNLIVVPMIVGLGVDHGLYLRAHAGDALELRADGLGPLAVVVGTTLAGFGTLAWSEYPALSRLGFCAALGFLWAVVLTLLWFPTLAPLRRLSYERLR